MLDKETEASLRRLLGSSAGTSGYQEFSNSCVVDVDVQSLPDKKA